jgi:hypothetical protein
MKELTGKEFQIEFPLDWFVRRGAIEGVLESATEEAASLNGIFHSLMEEELWPTYCQNMSK